MSSGRSLALGRQRWQRTHCGAATRSSRRSHESSRRATRPPRQLRRERGWRLSCAVPPEAYGINGWEGFIWRWRAGRLSRVTRLAVTTQICPRCFPYRLVLLYQKTPFARRRLCSVSVWSKRASRFLNGIRTPPRNSGKANRRRAHPLPRTGAHGLAS